MAKTRTGKYNLRIERLPVVYAAQTANGEEVPSWPDPTPAQEYFAARLNLTGGEQIVQGLRNSTGSMKLSIKGRAIPFNAADRVRVKVTGELFNITGMSRDTGETILLIERVIQQTVAQEGGQ